MDLRVKRLCAGAFLPGRATPGSAGMDLRACCGEDGILLQPMQRVLVPTGLAIELPGPDYVALVFARSGMALRQGLALANGVGVIDSDYRGELQVLVVNLSQQPVRVAHGERIAQLLIMPVALPQMIELVNLSDTARGTGGFGSTGVE